VFISFDFVKDQGLKFPVRSCDQQPINGMIDGFPSDSTCKCNSCDKTCSFDTKTTFPVLEGFSYLTVGLVYLFVIIFTFVIYVCKYCYKKKNPYYNSRSSSLDSTVLNQNMLTSNQTTIGHSYSANNINTIVRK